MIEDADRINNYLPLAYRAPKERDYVRFLWETFDTNVTHGKYQFAFLAYHMLVMSFVYFNIWQIKLFRPRQFETALVGFSKDMEKDLLTASSPFVFSVVNERAVLRFLKLIQCDNSKIGVYAQLVNDRNDTAHANGNIFFNAEVELERKIRDVLRAVDEIQSHSKEIILEGYRNFLLSSCKPDEREFPDASDQVIEVLVKGNYLSAQDVAFCRAFPISSLSGEPEFAEISSLHEALAQFDPLDEGGAEVA